MPLTNSARAPLIVLCTFALSGAVCAQTQTAPTGSPAADSPATQHSPSKGGPSEALQWNSVGATAQCRDGTFFHGKVAGQSCAEHGGIRKLLQARGQDLIR
jgi:hypothetical protein